MSQSPPSTLGKYQIIREIARSNDIVYEAYDPVMNRRVAVKELNVPGNLSESKKEERLKRFLREARAAGSLIHPNIVTIYEVSEDSGRNYIAMEYLDGRNLRQEMDSHGYLEQDRAIEIAIEILKALTYAHENGVIHRDIKPENIQLLSGGAVKLTDFGIARLTFEPNLTMDGQIFGTPSYMSPEQINGKDLDARSDLFSIGIILYEMISGQKPFQGDSVMSISYAIMNNTPSPPQQAHGQLWSVIQRTLDKTPTMRPANAEELIRDLKGCLAAIRAGNVVLDPNPAPPQPSYGAPPMQSPQPPPSYNYNQPPPPQPGSFQPYNPYGSQPQPPQMPQQPYPPQMPQGYQPYNPYGQPPGGQPGNPQLPIYYPPPRRQPLISTEAKQILARLILTFIIIGSIFVAILIAINSVATATSSSAERTRADAPIADRLDEARLLVQQGVLAQSDDLRRRSWSKASQLWSDAIDAQPAQETVFREDAARSFLNAADTLDRSAKSVASREAARQALSFAEGYLPSLEQQANIYLRGV